MLVNMKVTVEHGWHRVADGHGYSESLYTDGCCKKSSKFGVGIECTLLRNFTVMQQYSFSEGAGVAQSV